MRICSGAEEGAAELRSAWADEASAPARARSGEMPVPTRASAGDAPVAPLAEFGEDSGTIRICGVCLLAARSTSTALNSTHLPSGEGTGSPTRLRAIMSSKVKGRLACDNVATEKERTT